MSRLTSDHLVIRADAGTRIGGGHMMRCIAIAEEWQSRGGTVKFVSCCPQGDLRSQILTRGFALTPLQEPHPAPIDWEIVYRELRSLRAGWVILDGYHFDLCYERRIRELDHFVLVVDDLADRACHDVDILLNQNLGADQLDYHLNSEAQTLLGAKYALVRNEFLQIGPRIEPLPRIGSKVLVTMGSSDPNNVAAKVISALKWIPGRMIEVVVAVGLSNPNEPELRALADESRFRIRVVRPTECGISNLMNWADVAISAAGSTCWELLYMGVPTMTIVVAQNQGGISAALHGASIAPSLGWYNDVSAKIIAAELQLLLEDQRLREQMRISGQNLVDGRGSARVIDRMEAFPLEE